VTYDPRNRAVSFQRDGLPVFATLNALPDIASVHMVGPVVDVISIQAVPGFEGAWRGTKSYLATEGTVVATAPNWVFQIRMLAPDSVRFVNGPGARITSPSARVVSS